MAVSKKKINPNPPKKTAKTVVQDDVMPRLVDPQKEMLRGINDIDDSKVNFKSKDDVIKNFMFLVQIIAANITAAGKIPPNINFDDLISYGVSGLIKAWENFDKKKSVKFKVYASYRIRGEILDKIRKEWKYQNPGGYKSVNKTEKRVAQAAIDTKGLASGGTEENIKNIAANSAVAYLLSFEDNQGESVSESVAGLDETVVNQIDFSIEKKALWSAVKSLDEDEKKIIKYFYIDDKSQKDISDELGYSKSKISRMHATILNKLRLRLQRRLNYE